MYSIIIALAFGTASATVREEMVEEINNSPGVTWKAAISPRFVGAPLGSHKHLYGAKSMSTADIEQAISEGFLVVAPSVSEEAALSIPDSFDSEENWPQCAKVIGDIRDQSNCGCCWAFGAASAASDRACIASNGSIAVPMSAQDVCFNAESSGCNGGTLYTPWQFISTDGVVSGGQCLDDVADPPSDPFDGEGYCASFSLPHCFHHGPENTSPYPAEGDEGCPAVTSSPAGPTACDENSTVADFAADKYSFTGSVYIYGSGSASVSTIQSAIMTDGPVEAAFSVYSDFELYSSGIYSHTTGSYEGGHAIRIVGWGTEDGTDYWKVANSWNPYWGEEGYFRIVRGTDECGIEDQVYASAPSAQWDKKANL